MQQEAADSGDALQGIPPEESPDWLYREYYPRIYRHLAVRSHSEFLADDLAQDTLLQAMRHKDSFAGRGSRMNWLLTIANNMHNRHLAHEKRFRRVLETRFAESSGRSLPEEDGENAMAEAVRDLRAELAALPASLRAPLELTALRGRGYVEAAAALGIEVTTLRMRIHRAKKILEKRLNRHRDLF